MIAVALCLVGMFLTAGCSKEEFVEESKDSLWTSQYIAIGIVCLALAIGVFHANDAAAIVGGVVVVVIAIGLGALWYCTLHSEPPKEQPHGKITFLAEAEKGEFHVRIDGSNVRFDSKMASFHSGIFGGTSDGEYTVRVTPGVHEISMGWSYEVGTYEESTVLDIRSAVDVPAGETRYFLLANVSEKISLTELDRAGYERHRKYLVQEPDSRGPRPSPSPPPSRELPLLAYVKLLAKMDAAKDHLSAEEERLLVLAYTQTLMDEGSKEQQQLIARIVKMKLGLGR